MRSAIVILHFVLVFLTTFSVEARQYRLGVIQAGDQAANSAVQTAFDRSLKSILPPDTTFQFQAIAFRSAEWNRDSSKVKARQLAEMKGIDLILAIGPWVAEDLLEAGCTTPIIALNRIDPYVEGLTDSAYIPFARNLTLQAIPNKIENDIALLYRLRPFKKLGFLFFPSGMDSSRLIARVEAAAQSVGATSATAFGHNNAGTYAFLKAYAALPPDVDAVYLFPLWALDADRIKELGNRMAADRRPSVSFEGLYAVDKGVLISSAVLPHEAEARFAAWKALQIFRGMVPQTLPTQLPFSPRLSVNAQTAATLGIDLTLEMSIEAEFIKQVQDQPVDMLPLSDAIAKAIDLNPGLSAENDRRQQSVIHIGLARTSFRPTLGAFGMADYVDDNTLHNQRLEAPAPELMRNGRFRAGLSLDLPVWSLESSRATAKARTESSVDSARFDTTALALEADIAGAYFEALRANAIRFAHQMQVHLSNTTAELARGMVASGERPKSELTRWRVEELQDRQVATELDNQSNMARIRLNALMNQSSVNSLVLDSTLITVDAFWDAYELVRPYIATEAARLKLIDQLVQDALKESPRVRLASRQLETQRAAVSLLHAGAAPNIGLRSSVGLVDEFKLAGSYEEKQPVWSIGAYLHWPIFDGGRRSGESRLAQLKVSELEYRKDQVGLQVMEQVSQLVRELSAAAAQAVAAEREAELSNAVVAAAVDEYSAAQEGTDATVNAGNAAFAAQSRLVCAHARFMETLYQLVCAVGWSPHQASMTPARLLRFRLSSR